MHLRRLDDGRLRWMWCSPPPTPSSWAGLWNTTPFLGTSACAGPRSFASKAASSPPTKRPSSAWSTVSYAPADLERETYAWARRVAENSPEALRMAKIQMNKAQDAQGFHPGPGRLPRRLPGHAAHARIVASHGGRAAASHRRSGRARQARRPLRPDPHFSTKEPN